jgi:hypothetical protein
MMCLRLLKNIGDNSPKYNNEKKNKLDACSLTFHIVIRPHVCGSFGMKLKQMFIHIGLDIYVISTMDIAW